MLRADDTGGRSGCLRRPQGGYHQPYTWVVLLLYFTTAHASLVLLGVLGLARAMAGQGFRYPLIGGAKGNGEKLM